MDAKRLQRLQRLASVKLIIAGCLTAIVAWFALGQAQAQFVNPVPPPPAPTFNPSNPSTLPQSPETPVSPALPSGPSGSGVPSGLNERTPVTGSHTGTAASVDTTPRVSSAEVGHRGHVRRLRHGRSYAVRVTGPSYFPGLGIIYPPYPDPCHWRQAWEGPWVGSWMYTCS
jgi:hypothetical protein